ncbi:MAG TPA: proton-conducting transporter membrane subunit [Nonomuraea sp.]|nr:proton-conducting transporter membrane subunit [Nonomuraea sp.]
MNALLVLLPAAAGGLLLLLRRAARTISLAAAALTLAVAVGAAVARPAADVGPYVGFGLGEGLAVDGLSAVMAVTVAAAGLGVLVFAAGRLREARFHGLMLVFVAAMLLTVTAADLVLLLVGWEVMGAMSYALIGYWWHEPRRVRSGAVAFVTTRAGDLGLYVAAGAALAGGTLRLAGLDGIGAPWRDLVAGGIVLAALGKSAQGPFAYWLSRAMDGPSPVSALLHSATMVAAGAYLLLRVHGLLAATGWAAVVVTWAGAVTALLLGAVAVAQRELKQLLAASTCAQLGFVVAAAGAAAVAGGAAHLVAHAAVKSLLFLAAGAWLSVLGTQRLPELAGAGRRFPQAGLAFAVGAVALAGVPPLSLWVTKDLILTSVRDPWLHAMLLVAALLAAAYSAKALHAVWRPGPSTRTGEGGQPRGGGAGGRPDTAPGRASGSVGPWEWGPMGVLALGAAGLGVVGLPAVFQAWARLVGEPGAAGPAAGGPALSGVLAVAVVLGTLAARQRAATRAQPWDVAAPGTAVFRDWLGLERAAVGVVWRPVTAVARGVAWFDDHVVDAAVEGVARAGLGAARLVRSPFEGGVDGVVRAVARAAARLGRLVRRLQTGLVHTYLAQAVTVLILLAVAFVIVR